MSSFLTQCPHCHTSFRITDRQVEAANGTVRCGACLGLFSAVSNRITVRQPLTPEQLEALRLPPEEIDDETWYSVPTALAAEDPETLSTWSRRSPAPPSRPLPAALERPSTPAAAPEAVERTEPPAPPAFAERDYDVPLGDFNLDSEFDDDDYDHSDQTLTDLDADAEADEAEAEAEAEYEDESEDEESEDEESGDEDDPGDEAELENDADSDHEDTDWLEEADPEITSDLVGEDEFEDDDDDQAYTEADSSVMATAARRLPDPDFEKQTYRNRLATLRDEAALEPLASDSLDTLTSEPLLLNTAPRRSPLAVAALCALNLLLAALFAFQYVAANLDQLSRSPAFAPALPWVCRVLDCPVPQRAGITSLRSQELLVRSHARYPQALDVSIVFSNDADLPQPFPALELGFADINNRVLANRLFQPGEYLEPELLALGEMPPGASVQVSLELADPGSAAVNYTLTFREP